MKSRVFLAALLAGAIGMGALAAEDPPRQSKADDSKKANEVREQGLERRLVTLEDRCRKMLDLQIAVYNGTRDLNKVIEGTPAKKPRPEDKKAALKLAAKEKDLVMAATKAIEMLAKEEAALAISEVFEELRKDMKRVQRRLKTSDVGSDTQAMEQEIIDCLEDLIRAFKKR
jgi:hypothetical protein